MRVGGDRRGVALALCISLLEAASSQQAWAEPPAVGSATATAEQQREQAKRAYEDGAKAANQGQWDKARAAFLVAWGLKQHWQIALNLGQAELKVGKYRDAVEHLEYFLRQAEGVNPVDRKRAEQMSEDARGHLGEVSISVSQPGAEAMLDQTVVGKAPLGKALLVEPGQHVVAVRLEGFIPAQKTIEVGARSSTEVRFELSRVEEPRSTPRDEESQQARLRGETPARRESRDFRLWTVAGGGVLAATALGVGVGFTLKANGSGREAAQKLDVLSDAVAHGMLPAGENLCGTSAPSSHGKPCGAIKQSLMNQDSFQTIAIAGYAVAGAAAVGTLVLALRSHRRTEATALQLVPAIGSTTYGALVRASF